MKVSINHQFFDLVPSNPVSDVLSIDLTEPGAKADYIEALAAELLQMSETDPSELRPGTMSTLSEAFVAASEVAIGLDSPEALFAPITSWESEAAVQVFTRFPMIRDGEVNKRFALEVADSMNYDQGQNFYRFCTLVTKLI